MVIITDKVNLEVNLSLDSDVASSFWDSEKYDSNFELW